jgi:hypothetical protein
MQKIDLFGTGTQAISDTITAQRRVNIIYDMRKDQENSPIVILQTPGLTPYVQLPFPGIRAMWQNGQYAFAVAQNGLFLIQNEGYTYLGSFGAIFAPNVFEMKTNLTQLVMADGQSIWTFDIANLSNLISQPGQILNGLASLQTLINNMWT